MKEKKYFGRILLLDLFDCKDGVCDDKDICTDFLEELVKEINMDKQSDAVMVTTDHKKYPDKKGLSGWIPLVESGIQIHTLSVTNFITIDLYSCNEFSKEVVIKIINKYFGPKRIDIPVKSKNGFILRGRNYY